MFMRCVIAVMITCLPIAMQAFDCTNWYIKGFAGLNLLSSPSIAEISTEDIGYALGGSVGYKFAQPFRLEGELAYRYNRLNLSLIVIDGDETNIAVKAEGNISSFSYMGNVFFDLPVHWIFVPYMGVGLGGFREWGGGSVPAVCEMNNKMRLKLNEAGAAYQAIVGLKLLHSNKIDAGFEYHFFDSIIDSSNQNHTLAITCRRLF